MTSALLVLVAVPVLLVSGAILSGAWTRFRFARTEGAFRCKVRAPFGNVPGIRRRWRAGWTHAVWTHDVLLVERGFVRQRTTAISVRSTGDLIRTMFADEVKGLGHDPVVLALQLDEGPLVEVAAPRPARTLLAGPFLAAAIPGLPASPRRGGAAAGDPDSAA
jgi:hypothetical protein